MKLNKKRHCTLCMSVHWYAMGRIQSENYVEYFDDHCIHVEHATDMHLNKKATTSSSEGPRKRNRLHSKEELWD